MLPHETVKKKTHTFGAVVNTFDSDKIGFQVTVCHQAGIVVGCQTTCVISYRFVALSMYLRARNKHSAVASLFSVSENYKDTEQTE